ncbi:Rft protein-domain-containing protein [Cantharellus anzutake]|uniref:Rft protein-domain-containing protein n=1 Tax=Cantharellus anzutake TaxID=1750568 RepID=UPI001906708C|nr:Rft protein-domain-containing protein [Cantharellus anzutake]KAF8335856.1 Rft protein-domain-containing protein [Cantharellus anzutake]
MQNPPASFGAVLPLVGLQLFSRLFTFALNQVAVSIASPEVFGTASIQFDLLLSSILFLSREGVRNALLRSDSVENNPRKSSEVPAQAQRQLITNISLLPVFLGCPLAIIVGSVYASFASNSTTSQPHFKLAMHLYVLAAVFELISEPLYIRAQNNLEVGVRVRAEGVAVVAKAVFSLLPFVLFGKLRDSGFAWEWSLVCFALGQVAFGLSFLVVHLLHFRGIHGITFKSVPIKNGNRRSPWFNDELLRLSMIMTAQSIFKHFLTEGDRLIVSKFSALQDQGGFALATNYGSLIARVIFQPVEETSRVYFSKVLNQDHQTSDVLPSGRPRAEKSPPANKKKAIVESMRTLGTVLSVYAHLTLLFLAFGPPCIPTLLSIVLPRQYLLTSAPRVLIAYCWYLPVMAFNGVLEAFFSATASSNDLVTQSRALMASSLLFIVSSFWLSEGLGLKETGLVYANVLNLGARAWYAWGFTKSYYKKHGEKHHRIAQSGESRRVVPKTGVLICSIAMGVIVRISYRTLGSPFGLLAHKIIHMAIAVSAVLFWFVVCWFNEETLVSDIRWTIFRNK